jgi:glycosyltransferase involved in cell wall biosynthesis
MNKPEISVVMPVYNAEKFLESAIKSILNQTFTDFEFIIVDDGSEDRSSEIVKSFKDARIKFFEREKLGIVEQLNFGIEKSSTELIARMDSDDLCDSTRLEIQYNYLKANKDISLVGSSFNMIDENGKVIMQKNLPEYHNEIEFMMPIISSLQHGSILVQKKAIVEIGGYKTGSLFAEDHELFLRMLLAGIKMHNIQIPLCSYRIWAGASTSDSKHKIQDVSVYKNGIYYLNNIYKENSGRDFNYQYRIGLLEYHRGDINSARKHLFLSLKLKPERFFNLSRYLIISMFGDKLVKWLRSKGILGKISILISKCTKKDFHIISPFD